MVYCCKIRTILALEKVPAGENASGIPFLGCNESLKQLFLQHISPKNKPLAFVRVVVNDPAEVSWGSSQKSLPAFIPDCGQVLIDGGYQVKFRRRLIQRIILLISPLCFLHRVFLLVAFQLLQYDLLHIQPVVGSQKKGRVENVGQLH